MSCEEHTLNPDVQSLHGHRAVLRVQIRTPRNPKGSVVQTRTPSQPFKLALRAKAKNPFARRPDYDVLVNGEVVGEVYYNLTGYVGSLPQKDGPDLTLGEQGISVYRAEVARINREARTCTRPG